MSRKVDKPKPVSVYVRCRPRSQAEKDAGSHSIIECTKKEVIVRNGNANLNKKYTFDHVYGPLSSQVDVYKGVAASTVEEVLQGYNCTIFAYGQTGTGKTHTMEGCRGIGSNTPWEKDPNIGLIPRAMSHMFDKLNSQASDFSVRVSMLELYNEELFDLLSPHDSTQKLRLFEDSTRKGSVVIQGLEEVQVMCKDEVYSLIERAMQKRQTAATLLNAASSRSHVVFTATVHIKTVSQDEITDSEEEIFKMGKLNLVDLAGSENIGRSGAQNARAREAGNINQSLLTLGRVITALVDRAPHVPYRESKLTRLLQDSLGGRTQTSIVATISPAHCNLDETLSTLDYANRAKNILNKPEINQRSSKKALIKEYTAEIEKLKKDLQMAREKGGVYLEYDKYTEMEQRMKSQAELIKEKEQQLNSLITMRSKVENLFTDSIKQIDGLHKKIARKERVESQNKLLISNYIKNTRNNYSIFNQFITQRKQAIDEDFHHLESILTKGIYTPFSADKAKDYESVASEQSHEMLNNLMETIVRGLNISVSQRDSCHEQWLQNYVTTSVLPLLQQCMQSTVQIKQHSEDVNKDLIARITNNYTATSSKIDDMIESISYMRKSCDGKASKILQIMEDRRSFLDETKANCGPKASVIFTRTQQVLQNKLMQINQELTKALDEARASTESYIAETVTVLQESDKDVGKRLDDIIASHNHAYDGLIKGHQLPLKEELNVQLEETINAASSNNSLTSRKICELGEIMEGVDRSLGWMKRSYDEMISTTCQETQASHQQIITRADTPEHPHVHAIIDARCKCDIAVIECKKERETKLKEIYNGADKLSQDVQEMRVNTCNLLQQQNNFLDELSEHITEDLATGTTPKRARLNRLKLQKSNDYKLDMIESDEENNNPNNVLDMSY